MGTQVEVPGHGIVEFPDGMTDAQIESAIKANMSSGPSKDWQQKAAETMWRAENPGKAKVADFTAGATGLMRGGVNLMGGMFGQDKLGEKVWPSNLSRDTGYKLAGTLADPVGLTVAGGAAKILPVAKVLGQGFVGGTKAVATNAAAGAAAGGIVGGLSEDGTALEGATLGGALGVALPAAIATGRYIGRRLGEVANLITPGGAKRISDKYVNTIISEANKDEIILALKNAPELLQGSKPTASQAVSNLPSGSPIQAHQKLVSQESGGISAQFGQRIADQRAAGQKALSFAGTEDEIQTLVAARTKAVDPFYRAVEKSTASVKSSSVVNEINDIIDKNVNRAAIADPLRKIRDALVLKTDKGWRLENNPQNLKSLSDDISDMMGKKTVDGKDEFNVKVLRQIKEKLDKQIGIAEPSYAQAQTVFADMSKPINVMQIGSTLKDKLLNPSGTETPGTFLRAWDNEKKLMKEAIGFGRKGADSYLTPQQMDDVGALVKDLERNVSSKNPLQKTDLRGGVNVAGETTVSLPNLLSRPAMMANYVLKMAGRNIEPEIDAYLAKLYLNPKELGKVLSKVDPAQRARFNAIVQSYSTTNAANLQAQQERQEETQ